MKFRLAIIILISLITAVSCSKPENGRMDNTSPSSQYGEASDITPRLKDLAIFPIGVAVNYQPLKNEPEFTETVRREFNQIVAGYEMKHHAIVQDDGRYDFTKADEVVNFGFNAGMSVYGHTLVWHQNQNGKYLNILLSARDIKKTNLIANGGFEDGMTGWVVANTGEPHGASSFTTTNAASGVYEGTSALKVITDRNYGLNQWKVQVFSPEFDAKKGVTYYVSFRIKTTSPNGSIRLSANPIQSVVYPYQEDQDDIGTTWKNIIWSVTMKDDEPSQRIAFDVGKVAGTCYIDDVEVWEPRTVGNGTEANAVAVLVDSFMNNFITAMITRYKDKVKSWDVVNEALTESGTIRNSASTPIPGGVNRDDYFFWQDYLGRDYALKAFQHAAAADSTATLYINDFNLESNARKLDSLIVYVKELKNKGAKIDGIGTQMHVTINTAYSGIDAMFRKLASTGLKVRISELDVRINPGNNSDFSSGVIPESIIQSQVAMYKYIVKSYLNHVPSNQRAGILVWGVNDKNSWLYNNGNDYPLLFDNSYKPKPAFDGFAEGFGK